MVAFLMAAMVLVLHSAPIGEESMMRFTPPPFYDELRVKRSYEYQLIEDGVEKEEEKTSCEPRIKKNIVLRSHD